jgi:Tol biopolymer transport system component
VIGLIAASSGSISPDGQKLAFRAKDTMGRVALWVRALDNPTAQPLPDTDDGGGPFWSPDGETLVFFANQKLKTISLRGGTSVTVADAPSSRGGSWSRNGTILFTSGATGPLNRVASTGGALAPATQLLPQQSGHRFPWFLPDGKHFLYMALKPGRFGHLRRFSRFRCGPATSGLRLARCLRAPRLPSFCSARNIIRAVV